MSSTDPSQNQTSNNTNNNSNKNTNSNSNSNVNQNTSSSNSVSNSTSSATGGNASSNAQGGAGGQGGQGGNGGSATGGQAAGGSATLANAGNGGGAYIGATTDTTNEARIPVGTAIAPTVIVGNDQCLIPVSVGLQLVNVGISGGNARRDEICELMKLSDRLKYLGQYQAAVRILAIGDTRVEQALKDVGGYVPVVTEPVVRAKLRRNEFEGRDLSQVPVVSPSITLNRY